MTRQELEVLRLKSQIQALQTLVAMLYSGLVATSPQGARELRDSFAALRRDHARITLKGLRPEYSDLVAGEYQDALDSLLAFIERNVDEVGVTTKRRRAKAPAGAQARNRPSN